VQRDDGNVAVRYETQLTFEGVLPVDLHSHYMPEC
jgi:hypothetical protein